MDDSNDTKSNKKYKLLQRDGANNKFFGVCSGIANYYDSDPFFIRAIFVAGFFSGVPFTLILYVIIILFTDRVK